MHTIDPKEINETFTSMQSAADYGTDVLGSTYYKKMLYDNGVSPIQYDIAVPELKLGEEIYLHFVNNTSGMTAKRQKLFVQNLLRRHIAARLSHLSPDKQHAAQLYILQLSCAMSGASLTAAELDYFAQMDIDILKEIVETSIIETADRVILPQLTEKIICQAENTAAPETGLPTDSQMYSAAVYLKSDALRRFPFIIGIASAVQEDIANIIEDYSGNASENDLNCIQPEDKKEILSCIVSALALTSFFFSMLLITDHISDSAAYKLRASSLHAAFSSYIAQFFTEFSVVMMPLLALLKTSFGFSALQMMLGSLKNALDYFTDNSSTPHTLDVDGAVIAAPTQGQDAMPNGRQKQTETQYNF